jgi:pyruvate formate lyase activating enzyme
LNKQSTPEPSLFNAWQIANEKLDYVYLGNIMSDEKSNTHCPSCNALLVKRSGYFTEITENLSGKPSGECVCAKCGAEINIII